MSQTKANSIPLNNPRTINGWALFDWANSSYSLVIATAIFPPYFLNATTKVVSVFGIEMYSSTLYAYAISLAYLIIAILSPLLSGIADYSGRKKAFLRFFTSMGALSCMALFLFTGMEEDASAAYNGGQLALGTIGFMMATIGWAGSLVFYNAYLPEIVTEDRYDEVSARGFAFGYIGSVLLLITNLVIILKPDWFGLSDSVAVRIAFIMVGLWWIGFAQVSFARLPKDARIKGQKNLMSKGFEEIRKVWRQVRNQVNIRSFLISFFCYSAGVQTILFLAATFAEEELDFGSSELILVILLLQILAIAGAYLAAKLSDLKGNKFSLITMLVIWMSICVVAYFVDGKTQFYGVAAAVGLVMGGIQSLSRSTYSKLLPENTPDTTSFFSFYDVLEKVAIVLGTFSFGFINQLAGGMRNSILALAIFFLLGILVLLTVKVQPIKVESHKS